VNSFDDRCAADMYAFGGLVFFLVTGTSLNAELTQELADASCHGELGSKRR
jgi:hypothetical protein